MARFDLAESAQRDLESIATYTEETWGRTQARAYIETLEARLSQLAERPQIGRPREDLAQGVRSFTHDQHVIYYLPSETGITVVRILHQRQDISGQFDDPAT